MKILIIENVIELLLTMSNYLSKEKGYYSHSFFKKNKTKRLNIRIKFKHYTAKGNANILSYNFQTLGFFSQDNWNINEKLFIEPDIRYDFNLRYRGFFLPRLAIMYHFSKKFFTLLNGGMGYKMPTPFTDEAERNRYQNVENILDVIQTTHENIISGNLNNPIFNELYMPPDGRVGNLVLKFDLY